MQRAYGLEIPESVEEACLPGRVALLVYDMQDGIAEHIRDRPQIVKRVATLLAAARAARVPVLYVRHVSLPNEMSGVAALRTAMAWQRVGGVTDVRSLFPPDAPQTQILPEVAPRNGEPVFDKLGMSAFVGTPVDVVLRDKGIGTVAVVGAVLEIGIEPTVRHAADLGYLPVVVEDACGVVEPSAAARSLAALDYMMMSLRTDSQTILTAWSQARSR